MAVEAFNKNKSFSVIKLDLNLTKKHVKCYTWSTTLYDALTGTLWKVDQRYLGGFDMWCWRRMEIIRTDGGICYKKGRLTALVTSWVGTAF